MAEACQRLLNKLPNATLQAIALAKMEGHTNPEIAAQQDCSLATIERRLGWTRDIWTEEHAC